MVKFEIETSNEIIRKGDIFTIIVKIINDGDNPIRLINNKINLPYGFEVKQKKLRIMKDITEWIFPKVSISKLDSIPQKSLSIYFDGESHKEDDKSLVQYETPIFLQKSDQFTKTLHVLCNGPISYHPRPDTYKITGNLKYFEINEQKNRFQTQYKEITILPAISTILIGSGFGGFLGTLVKYEFTITLDLNYMLDFIGKIIFGLIFSLIAGIMFLRKGNVQYIITVEDYLGGIIIGFVAGYAGISFIEGILSI